MSYPIRIVYDGTKLSAEIDGAPALVRSSSVSQQGSLLTIALEIGDVEDEDPES